MRNPNRPDVPKEFLKRYYGPDSDPKERKDFEEWIRAKREKLKKSNAFDNVKEAIDAAVNMQKKEPLSLPSVWKEPIDVGNRYAVIRIEDLEDAYVSGYKEKASDQIITNLSNGRADGIDHIKEV